MSDDLFNLITSRMNRCINLLDIGAAGGVIQGWEKFGEKARVFCFEARDEEVGRISRAETASNVEYFPLAVAGHNGEIDLNVTVNPGCSSVYPPVEELYRRYPGNAMLRPIKKVRCAATTIDDFLTSQNIESVQAIKVDTQGSELDILRSSEIALKNCLFLNIEVEFNELYSGQALFCDVDRFLRDRGFVLWRLNNLAHYSTGAVGGELNAMLIGSEPGGSHMVPVGHGQLFWGDALYVRAEATPSNANSLGREDGLAGAALVTQWKYYDLALEMIRKIGDKELLADAYKILNSSFTPDFLSEYRADVFEITSLAKRSEAGIEIDFSESDGCAVYGPYIQLPYGDFEITFCWEALDLESQPLASNITFDVANEACRVASVDVFGAAGSALLQQGNVSLQFRNESPIGRFEFRIWITGRPFQGSLTFKGATLRQL